MMITDNQKIQAAAEAESLLRSCPTFFQDIENLLTQMKCGFVPETSEDEINTAIKEGNRHKVGALVMQLLFESAEEDELSVYRKQYEDRMIKDA